MSAEAAPEFSLRALVNATIDSGDGTETPSLLAEQVLATLPPEHVLDALCAALPGYVAVVMGDHRRRPMVPQNQSPKVARAIASNWQRICRAPIHIADNVYKALGDCTYDDLIFAETERVSLAAKHAAWAERYRRYAHLLREHGVKTIADLPEEAQAVIEADYT